MSRENVWSWTDLAKAFLVQYKYMTDSGSDRISLQNMEKKATKTFKQYAHKWGDLEAQVQPPMTNKELNKMFLNTLKVPYYDLIIRNLNTIFLDVVSTEEMIENGVKLGKLESTKT